MSKPSKEIPRIQFHGKVPHKACRFSHNAMATVFEIFAIHDDAGYAEQAAREVFRELDRLELELSRFIENSDISRINNLKKDQSTQIGLDAFECLKQCARLTSQTIGAFDVTAGNPTRLNQLHLNESDFSVTLIADSIHVDLGGYGKGYAIDLMASHFREWDIRSVLIHGGKSSALALAEPPGEKGWPVTLSDPSRPGQILSHVHLKNRAISASGLQKGRHIINPHTGKPVDDKLASWASSSDGATSDALSTAFMVMNPEEIEEFCTKNPDTRGLVILKANKDRAKKTSVIKCGDWDILS
ncbi:MAG: FAD:protein FMN transferase [Candidatus Aminicenantes bacterium]|jgi:thiamine biosynthesis lipoprotein